ncbi:TTC28, partial [Symbiodinium necroappetens]
VLCTCGLLFELTCPLALFFPSIRALMICTAVSFHLGNLFLITLNGDRFLTWIWMLLFVLDFPATLFNRAAESARSPSEDVFLLESPDLKADISAGRRRHLQTVYGLLAAVVVATWLAVGLARSASLRHANWPFVGPDMFSRVGRWSSPSPFRDVLLDQIRTRRRAREAPAPKPAQPGAALGGTAKGPVGLSELIGALGCLMIRFCECTDLAELRVRAALASVCFGRPSIPERTAARELSAALLACAKARNAATEGAQAVQPAQEASKLRERMGDPKGAALAACEEAKAYHSMKAQAATRKAALNAVALAKEACDSKTEALAWHCACLAHAAAGQKLDAIKAGRQALTLAREVRDVEVIGTALQALMQANGEEEKAASVAEEELMMAKKVGDRRREAYAQLKMAQAMIGQDRPRDALRRATEAAERLKEMGDLKGEAKATQLLVELQCQARRAMEASRTAKEAQRLFKEAGDMKGCVGVLQILTSLHLEAGDPHAAIQAARDQVKLFREAGFKEEEASATLGLAEMTQQTMGPRDALHLGLKANTNAMQAAKQAEELARKSGDEKVLISALQAVGEAYSSADRFNEGIDAAKEALQMVEKDPVKEDAARAAALACMANVQLQVAHYDVNNPGARIRPRGLKEAMKAAEEALDLHRKLGDRNGEITGIQRIFHAHLLSQDGPNSLRYAREYMELAQATEQKENLGSALVSLCQGHFLCRNWDEAERANLEARAIFEKSRMHENIEVCDQIMREIKQEMERDRRPTQPMGRANAAQGAGQGYNSLLPERQASRAQQDGVPSGGFRGVPAGGFGSSESTQASPMGFVVPSARVKAVKAQARVTWPGPQTAPRGTAATATATLRQAMALEATRHQVPAVAAEVPALVGDRLVMVSPAAHATAAWEVATLDMEAPEVSLPVASASPECRQVVLAQIKVYRQREDRVCRLVVLAGQRVPRISSLGPAARPSPVLLGSEALAEAQPAGQSWVRASVPHEPRRRRNLLTETLNTAVMAGRSSGILGQAQSEEATHQLQRWLSQEDAERDAARAVLQRLHATVEVHRQRLVLLLARPPGGGEVAISRAKEVVRDLEAEASTIDLADVSQGGVHGALLPSSIRGNHAVLSQSLKETQRQCDSLNREM